MTQSATTITCALDEALNYANMGLAVFPLQPGTKRPMTAHGVKDATTDPAVITEWWTRTPDAGIGLAARAERVGDPCFLEFDQQPWLPAWAKESNQPMPQTRQHKSGGKEAPHYIFTHTEKSLALSNCDGSTNGHEWFSFRADNRYIVAPPSIHPDSGKPYTCELDIAPVPIPDWLVDAIAKNGVRERDFASGLRRVDDDFDFDRFTDWIPHEIGNEDGAWYAFKECPVAGRRHKGQGVRGCALYYDGESLGFKCHAAECPSNVERKPGQGGISFLVSFLSEENGAYPGVIWPEKTAEEEAIGFGAVEANNGDDIPPVSDLEKFEPSGTSECSEEFKGAGKAISQIAPVCKTAVIKALVDGGLEPDESCGYGRVLEYAKQTNLPLGIALPAVLGVFSIVPDMDEMCGTRINEYVAVIGESGSGKNVAWDRALDVLGLRRDSEFVKNTAPTGARILMQYVGDRPASGRNSKNLPRVPGPRKMLIRSNEISDCFLAGRAESSTLINRLTDFWDENVFELPEPRGGGVCRANCRLSWVGGLPATADKPERFLDIFGRNTGFGLYDRFIFGYLNEPIDFDGKHAWDKSTTQGPVTDLDDHTSRLPGQWTVVTGFEQAAWRLYREWEPPQRLGNRLRHHAKKVAILFASANGETAITAPCMAAAINFMEWQCRLRAIFCGGQAQNQEGEFSEVAREAFEQMTRKGKVPFLPLRIAHDRDWGKRFGDRIVLQGIANLVKLKTIIPSYERGKDGRMYPSEYRYFLNPQLYGAAAGEAVLRNKAEYDEWQETQTQMPETAKEKATRLAGKMAK